MGSLFFSVITPAYNRAHVIERTIRSVLSQSFDNFEYIIVDDGSTDNTAQIVRSFNDPRISLLIHEQNRGIGSARNTAVEAATGKWVLPIDSDDELLPSALDIAYQRAQECSSDIMRVRFNVLWDTGKVTPNPPLKDEVWGYEDYLRNLEGARGAQETESIYRREVFQNIRWAKYHASTGETCFHLDCFKRYKGRTVPDTIRLYHTDSGNQTCQGISIAKTIMEAKDRANQVAEIVERHGMAMTQYSPRFYSNILAKGGMNNILVGKKKTGVNLALLAWSMEKINFKPLFIVMAGMLGPKILAGLFIFYKKINISLLRKWL